MKRGAIFCRNKLAVSDIDWSALNGVRVSSAWANPRLSQGRGVPGRDQRGRCAVSSPRRRFAMCSSFFCSSSMTLPSPLKPAP
uniref:Uncharacterized protein n=1 Tax=Pipistrellus kuhlii TaxID=59472 RepID=A0A7J7ZP51_PIPKU|nr:hypothetical protein mPipKuh1_018170 [Pipistrellus kuhlii]